MGTTGIQAGSLLLNLDGKAAGYLKSVEGGDIKANVINEQMGTEPFVTKHIGPPVYEEVALEAGLTLADDFYAWIADAWTKKYARRDVSVVVVDHNGNAREERQYFNALITAVTIPALDGASKEPAYLTLKLSPEYTRTRKGSGQKVTGPANTKKKSWLTSNFRLEIDGLDCKKVSKIDAITVKQTVAKAEVGSARDAEIEPATLEFPNLSITLAESSAQSWFDWHDDFVVKGNNSEKQEKSGAIVLLSSDLKAELARVELVNLGIFRIARGKLGTSETLAQVTAGLYCERMELKVAKAP